MDREQNEMGESRKDIGRKTENKRMEDRKVSRIHPESGL